MTVPTDVMKAVGKLLPKLASLPPALLSLFVQLAETLLNAPPEDKERALRRSIEAAAAKQSYRRPGRKTVK
jgi:hypothetical protein